MNLNFSKEQKEKIIKLLKSKWYILEADSNDWLTLSSFQIEHQLSQEVIDDIYLEITWDSNIIDSEKDDDWEEKRHIKVFTNAYNTKGEWFSYIIFNVNIIDEEYAELIALYKTEIANLLIKLAKDKKVITYYNLEKNLIDISEWNLSLFENDKKDNTYYLIEDICRDLRWDNLLNLSALIITKEWVPWSWYFEIMKNRGVLKKNYIDMTLEEKKSFHNNELERLYNHYNY